MKTALCFFIVLLSLSSSSVFAQTQGPATRKPGTTMPDDDSDDATDAEKNPPVAEPDVGSAEGETPETMPEMPPVGPGSEAMPDAGMGGVMGIPQVERDIGAGGDAAEKPAAVLPDAEEAVTTQSIIKDRRERKRIQNIDSRIFGSYRLNIAALKPFFEENDTYKQVYGTTSVMPALAVDYFFFDWYATLGLTFRMGYYSDKGRAVKRSGDKFVEDPEGKVDLTLIPLQGGAALEMTPFGYKWLVASGWIGAEATYFQEVRPRDNENEAQGDEKSKDNRKYTNSFWRYATAFGGSLNIRIDGMDPQAGSSLAVMGLRAIYLSPYIEIVQKTGSDKMHLSRRVIGLGFTFESIR